MTRAAPVFDHLAALTDDRGLFEHALHSAPRREHGYCVDDAARALVVTSRQPAPSRALLDMQGRYLDFVLAALEPDGRCHNRMSVAGDWCDEAALGDWWGRAVWGLGVAATQAVADSTRARALAGFHVACRARSPHRRSMAFAALGCAAVLDVRPDDAAAYGLLNDTVAVVGGGGQPDWPWPEDRLSYGNAVLAEALIVAGDVLGDAETSAEGLRRLAFLLRTETRDGHLSVTPVGGRGPGEDGPGFDQQPIEVAALADACAAAHRVTGAAEWSAAVELAWRWFEGDNDSNTVMIDHATGGGFDGLEAAGRNLNRGAESTLAALSTAQHAARIASVTCSAS